jgi:muramoyltetrapeptide carboxypeptidase
MPRRPDPLAPDDAVGVFLPSSPAREPFRGQGLQALRGLGFRPLEVADPLSAEDFRSRPPEAALADLQGFLADPGVKGLWAGRGGYGANYLLPLLGRLRVDRPKVVVASSDVSVLLWHLLDRLDLVVFYGPMVYGGLAAGEYDREQALAALTANRPRHEFSGEALCPGRARGVLTGGCLSNFASLAGTPHLPRVKGRILLLEDVNERPYRIDRLLWQCEQAGVFRSLRGLVLGEFPRCFRDDGEREAFFGRWRQRLAGLRIPVLCGLPFGHAACARIVPLGVDAEIEAEGGQGALRCEIGVKW